MELRFPAICAYSACGFGWITILMCTAIQIRTKFRWFHTYSDTHWGEFSQFDTYHGTYSSENDATSSRSAVLSNRVPGPVFLRRISASWRLAHPPCGHGLLCRSCIKLDGHSVFKSGVPRWHPWKQKKDHDMIRSITGNVPCGRSNRNPSNIMNILAFLNVRLQCNIRGTESQCSAGDEMQSLQSVHF